MTVSRWPALALVVGLALVGCSSPPGGPAELGAGFRYSSYGPAYDPGPDYWAGVGESMAAKFDGATPQAIWIVSEYGDDGTTVSFPREISSGAGDDPHLRFSDTDTNEAALDRFDAAGVQAWLQIEPGDADVDALFRMILDRYGHHESVVGIGLDVEWYRSGDDPSGVPITDAQAEGWLATAREYDPDYQLFFKHWDADWMPPNARDGLVFIDDSQGVESLDAMVAEFTAWAERFAPAPVGFQYGYDSDRAWWGELDDPPAAIGRRLIEAAPNTAGLFWVDFTVIDQFPPGDFD